jgi:hypothetical protein
MEPLVHGVLLVVASRDCDYSQLIMLAGGKI